MRQNQKNFLKLSLSFLITAFGTPSLSEILSVLAAACGLALFWSAIAFRSNKFWISVLWFAGVQAVQLNWMLAPEYMGTAIFGIYLLVILGLGLQFGLLTKLLRFPMTWGQIAGLSGFWVFMEWIRLFFLTGFAWNPIGLTLAANSYSLQMASLFGVYGLCFWVVFVNLLALKNVVDSPRMARCCIWALCALLPYGYGLIHQFVLERTVAPGKELSVALVQTALLPEQRDFFREKSDAYVHPLIQWDQILTQVQKLEADRFHLIVLSEGAIPNGPWQKIYPYEAVLTIWQSHFGEKSSADFPPLEASFGEGKRVSNAFWIQALSNHFQAEVIAGLDDREEGKVYNTAFHFTPNSGPVSRYRKQILIPMGEYIPFNQWKWLADVAYKTYGITSPFASGKGPVVFSGVVPMGVSICLEEAYSQLVRGIRLEGASLFVNLTNDVWFPCTRLPWHHFDHGRLRSVENGVCLLRATNTGVTAAVDCFGTPLAILPPSEKEATALHVQFRARSFSTLYTFLGDVPFLFFSGICAGFWGISQIKRKKKLL